MKISRSYLRRLIKEQVDLLFEQEEDPFATDDAAEEGGDDAAEEGGDDAAEEGGDEEGGEEEEEEEEEIDVSPEEEAALSKSADDQIMAHIVDFETKAMKSANVLGDEMLRPDPVNPEENAIELEVESKWYKKKVSSLLYEEAEDATNITGQASWVGSPDIDITVFSNDIARLVQNYDSLLDMEALIIAKAEDYIQTNYDQETAAYFIEVMDQQHDMRASEPTEMDDNLDPPPAIGSGYASQPGGA